MGKLLIEIGIPSIILMAIAWKVVKLWFFHSVPDTLKEVQKISKAGDKYDKTLDSL